MSEIFVGFRYAGGSDPCQKCIALEGIYPDYTDIPDDPHDNCDCTSDVTLEAAVTNLGSTTFTHPPVIVRERLGDMTIPRGGATNASIAITRTDSDAGGVNVSVKASRGGADVTVGGNYVHTDTEGTTTTQGVVFNYDDEVGGSNQYVYARYEVTERETVTQYEVAGEGQIAQHSVAVDRRFLGFEQLNADEVNEDGEPPIESEDDDGDDSDGDDDEMDAFSDFLGDDGDF